MVMVLSFSMKWLRAALSSNLTFTPNLCAAFVALAKISLNSLSFKFSLKNSLNSLKSFSSLKFSSFVGFVACICSSSSAKRLFMFVSFASRPCGFALLFANCISPLSMSAFSTFRKSSRREVISPFMLRPCLSIKSSPEFIACFKKS